MKHIISPDRKTLTIYVDDQERADLRELGEAIQTDANMHDFLEPLTCNSELQWTDPAWIGDLTSAPMLGILGGYRPVTSGGLCPSGPYGHKPAGPGRFQPILERWAFMDYQMRSVLEDLREKGESVFIS